MHGSHAHHHGVHAHHHHDHSSLSDRRLTLAIAINLLLTLAEAAGGLLSHSLGLLSDALHNFGDVGSLIIALAASRISRRPADARRTFGYKRAETVGALINLVILIVSGAYLLCEAGLRLFRPEAVAGETVVWLAGLALAVNLGTAALTLSLAKDSLNMRAAFLHNLSDALASVGVIAAGLLVATFGWNLADTIISALIAAYIIWQGFSMLPQTVHILMEGSPDGATVDQAVAAMEAFDGVARVHHVHLWQLDEHHSALEAHVVVRSLAEIEEIRAGLKQLLASELAIDHSTLEFETAATPDTHHLCHS